MNDEKLGMLYGNHIYIVRWFDSSFEVPAMPRSMLFMVGLVLFVSLVEPSFAQDTVCRFDDLLRKVDTALEKRAPYLLEDEEVRINIRRALAIGLWEQGRQIEACDKLQSVAEWLGVYIPGMRAGESLDGFLERNKRRVDEEIGLDPLFSFVPSKVLPSDLSEQRDDTLRGADFRGENFEGKWLAVLNLDEVILLGANLRGATLSHSSLREALLVEADLTGSLLGGADLSGAILHGARLTSSYMRGTTLVQADFYKADLSESLIKEASLQGADLSRANLAGCIFEPVSGSLPLTRGIAESRNLHLLTYNTTPHALIELREQLRSRGLRRQEREVTYAIEHTAMGQAGTPERLLKFALFDITCRFGMSPWRPIVILLYFIVIFSLPYMIAIRSKGRSGIWASSQSHAGGAREKLGEQERVTLSGLRLPLFALFFSLLSAFQIGWRDFNIGNLLLSLTPSGRVFRGTGWVRTVSTMQAILSVYLFALWLSTYFGRPFG